MALPVEFKVEIAFATDPYDPSPTWVDVSSKVLVDHEIEISRGRGDLYDTTTPSTASFTLDNSDGRFTAGYAGSPYYPNVKLGRRVRISARTPAGTWYPRFDGFMDKWPTSWAPTGTYAEAPVAAVDLLKRLERFGLVNDIITETYSRDSPAEHWTFGDPADTEIPVNDAGKTSLEIDTRYGTSPSVVFGNATGPGTDGLTAVQVTEARFLAYGSPLYPFFTGSSVTVEAFVRYNFATLPTDSDNWFQCSSAGTDVMQVFVDQGLLSAKFIRADGSTYTAVGATNVFDRRTHHLAAVFDASASQIRVYVDGQLDGSQSVAFAASAAPSGISYVAGIHSVHSAPFTAAYAHLAVYSSALTGARILEHARAGDCIPASDQESTTERFDRIVALAGIPGTSVGAAGTSDLGPLSDVAGRSYADLLADVVLTENGFLNVSTSGALTFWTRSNYYNATPALTLPAGGYGDDLEFVLDDAGLVNDFTATSGNGHEFRYVDTTSVTAYGTYSDSATLGTTSDAEAEAYAQMRVVTSQPAPRISQVTVDLMTQTSVAATVWGITELLGSTIKLTGLPTGAPASTVSLQVQGYTETYSTQGYDLTLNTATAAPAVWKVGDATYGTIDGPGGLAY